MDKIYNFEQYQGLNLDYSLIVNSTLDIKHKIEPCFISSVEFTINE